MKVEQFRGFNKEELQKVLRELLQRLEAEEVEVEGFSMSLQSTTKEKAN